MSASKQLQKVTDRLAGGGERRDGQVEMAEAVADAVASGDVVVVEAGTGTGKSLAYLTPIVAAGKQAVVATATIALQSQLVDQDVAAVSAGLDRDVSVALLKGRSNYLCRQRLEEFERSNRQEQLQILRGKNSSEQVEAILEWAESTETGDREELDPAPSFDTWRAVSVDADECPGVSRCPSGSSCFAEFARDRASQADVIITNHHYYGLNINSDDALLPEHDVVVIDEAHHFPEVIGATNGTEVSGGRLRRAARQVRTISTDEALFAKIDRSAQDLDDFLTGLVGQRLEPTLELTEVLAMAREKLNEVLGVLRKIDVRKESDTSARLDRIVLAATRLVADIDIVMTAGESKVIWVDGSPESPVLKLTPLDVGSVLEDGLWGRRSVVLTSATLPDGAVPSLGLDPSEVEVQRVASPFDYPSQGLLYCAAHLVEPRHSDYRQQAVAEISRLIEAAGGRTLCLFTSFKALQETAEGLQDVCDFPILKQGDASRQALLDTFRNDAESVLLGNLSFWQGVDVPGPSLKVVTIDRLPFPRPDDPILQARRDAVGPQAFRLVDLPRAQTLLAQAAGRLVRRTDDTGVVAVLDSRLATKKSYRWELIRALPDFKRTRDFDEVAEFLADEQ